MELKEKLAEIYHELKITYDFASELQFPSSISPQFILLQKLSHSFLIFLSLNIKQLEDDEDYDHENEENQKKSCSDLFKKDLIKSLNDVIKSLS